MAEINDLNVTDASNTARFPEDQAASTLNDGARALEGIVARWHNDINGSVATTGSANAYVMAANQTLSAYYDGLVLAFEANFTNTGAATVNVDGLGAKSIKKMGDASLTDLAADDIESGRRYVIIYDGTQFQAMSPLDSVRTNSNGDLLIGKTSLSISTAGAQIRGDGSVSTITRDGGTVWQINRLTDDGTLVNYMQAGSVEGSVSISGTTTSYNTTSDERRKKNVRDLAGGRGKEIIRAAAPQEYEDDKTNETKLGFVAQTVALHCPGVALPPNPSEGREFWSMDYGKMTPFLAAALRDALDEIDALTDRVAALETSI